MSAGPRAVVDFDLCVVGGGPVGAVLAAAVGRGGGRVAVIEAQPAPQAPGRERDPRVIALTRASERILRGLGAWALLETERLGCFRGMQVWDAGGAGRISFDAAELCESTLGFIIELRRLQWALEGCLAGLPSVTWFRPQGITALKPLDDRIEVNLDDGRRIGARLLAGADGTHSRVRSLAGIAEQRRDYGQKALVCDVQAEGAHGDVARQRFLATGPLALLPLAQPSACSIVWSTSPERAAILMALEPQAFCAELTEASDGCLGRVLDCGPRAEFGLERAYAERYVQPRLALLGDAAHRIHPLAGQGANLGFLDAAALAQVIIAAMDQGRDPGSLRVLRRYERWRRGENMAMLALMDGFKSLFGSEHPALRWLRNTGLHLTDAAGPVKRWIMARAMGLAGDLPDLARTPS